MSSPEGFSIGEWEVLPDLNRLRRGSDVTEIEPRVMAVLEELARIPGRVVTRDDLLRTVWNDVIVSDDALNRCITQLRRILGDDARAPRFIETISRRGYRLIAPVEKARTAGAPDATSSEQKEPAVHVLRTTLLGHHAEVAFGRDITDAEWERIVAAAGTSRPIVVRREDVFLKAQAELDARRFRIQTRIIGAAMPIFAGIAAFVVAALLVYGRPWQFGHGLGLILTISAIATFAALPARRRALDLSRAVIGAFARTLRASA